MAEEGAELERLRQERDLYRRLLRLSEAGEPESFLRDALALAVDVTGARQGYLELRDPRRPDDRAWSLAHGFDVDELEGVRSRVSSGVIGRALATGETILTHSALLDERFADRLSVRRGAIDAVICAPVEGAGALGVVYLQGRSAGGRFSDEDRERVELFAARLAPIASLLLARRAAQDDDPTREVRARHRFDGILGRSPAIAAVLRQAALAAPLDVHVLITGPSGTGKSQLARAIHDSGPRAAGPFIELNCAALPATLIESELFGARAGAHSEARRDLPGKVAAAEGGTLFLDEIAELPLDAQAKLLQLLQSRRYFPLGATAPVQANVRLIAASNADLERAVEEKRLREDLHYRLDVLRIRMPQLAERAGDLPEIARELLARAILQHALPRLELSAGALRAIEAAEWPGNVRQLENTLVGGAIRAAGEGARRVEAAHLFPGSASADSRQPEPVTFQDATRAFQRELLARTLRELDWNVTETARRLDLARSHVYTLIRAWNLSRGDD
jgi:Nif-specific regulatory protein